METEIWQVIPGYEKYEASTLGNIRSNWFNKVTVFKPSMHKTGYYKVNITVNKKKKTIKVHQLVAMAFLNHQPDKFDIVVDHINNIKTDNRLCNLQLLTNRENTTKETWGSSKHIGVSYRKNQNKWEAKIKINGLNRYLGLYEKEEDAAQAYQDALKNLKSMNLSDIFQARKTPIEFTQGQLEALTKVNDFLKSKDNFFLLAGYSGCGKTTIAENIANYKGATLLAPTNAAVNRLKEKINNTKLQYKTIHSLLFSTKDDNGNFVKDKSFLQGRTYIIDECSMVDKYILDTIIKDAIKKSCKIIFMGDSFQLEPVGEDPHIFNWENSFPEVFKPEWRYELTEVKRYDGSLLKIATEMRINKKPLFSQPDNSDLSFVPKFSSKLAKDIKAQSNYVVLTSTNQRRVLYNKKIRSFLFNNPNIDGRAQEGDMLVSVSNNEHYSNGEIYKIEGGILIESFEITVAVKNDKYKTYNALLYKHKKQYTLLIPDLEEPSLHGQTIYNSIKDGDTKVPFNIRKLLISKVEFYKNGEYQYFEMFNKNIIISTFGYAISCHKAQGQEWDNVYIDAYWLMPVWDAAKWFYTAITRAKCKVEVTQNKYLKTR